MTASVRHVIPSQRRHYRVTVPIDISIDGQEYTAQNWSISGCKIGAINIDAEPGDIRHLYVKIPFHGFDVGFITKARILRYDRKAKELAAEFIELDLRGQETLATFVHGIISGEMAAIGGVIRRLDQPVTPATIAKQHTPYLPPEEAERRREKGVRLYMIAGKLLAAVLLVVLYVNIFEMRVDTAFLTGRNDVILAPSAADVTFMAPLNEDVKAGAPILTLADQQLEDNIQASSFKVQDAKLEVARLDSAVDLEKKRLTAAHNIVSEESAAANDTVLSLQRNLAVKRVSLQRMQTLAKQGFIAGITLDKAESDYYDMERQLNMARQEAARRAQEETTVKAGFQVRDESVQAGIPDAEQLHLAAVNHLQNAENELKAMQARKQRLSIRAPADGRLVRAFTPLYGSAKYGEPVAIFERKGTRAIQAFLTQQEATHLAVGDKASVYFPSRWWSVPAKVVDIDFYTLTLGQTQGSLQWQNLQNDQFKTVLVTLEPAGDKALASMKDVPPGTASRVVFDLL